VELWINIDKHVINWQKFRSSWIPNIGVGKGVYVPPPPAWKLSRKSGTYPPRANLKIFGQT